WVAKNDKQKSFFSENKGYVASKKTPRIKLSGGISAYVKISEGCNHKCSFCIIPSLRGKLQSRYIEDIIEEIKELEEAGTKEVILISQDSTAYGLDIYRGEWKLAALLEEIATKTKIPWVRLMYSYPGEVTDEMLEVIAKYESILSYIDIPLQHSHPDTLTRMKRPLSGKETIDRIREKVPGVALRTTLITGFPGETEEEFEHLVDFVKEEKFDRVGVFAYSQEDTTAGAKLDNQLDSKTKQARRKKLLKLQEEISLEKNKGLIGQKIKVLVEKKFDDTLHGRSFRDAPEIDGKVIIEGVSESSESFIGEIVEVKITEADTYDLFAELV
ncbi:MAG TPA: 30S ribosomal protein S12 methylthiotransferase RimO, partial [Vampirovibrionales bacterium]